MFPLRRRAGETRSGSISFHGGRLSTGVFDFRAEHAILGEGEGVDPDFEMRR